MTTERCECCDLPAYSCGKSAEDKQRREGAATRGLLLGRGWRQAAFPGGCRRCGEPFGVGDLIIYHRDGWISECCAGGAS